MKWFFFSTSFSLRAAEVKAEAAKSEENENRSRHFPFTVKNFHLLGETQNNICAHQSKNVMIRLFEIKPSDRISRFCCCVARDVSLSDVTGIIMDRVSDGDSANRKEICFWYRRRGQTGFRRPTSITSCRPFLIPFRPFSMQISRLCNVFAPCNSAHHVWKALNYLQQTTAVAWKRSSENRNFLSTGIPMRRREFIFKIVPKPQAEFVEGAA